MLSIRPRNYREAVNLRQCLTLQGMIPELDDAQAEEIFRFINEDDGNAVSVTPGMLTCRKRNGEVVSTQTIAEVAAYTSILLTAGAMKITRPVSSSSSDGGVSGNNNNNNNNNNNG